MKNGNNRWVDLSNGVAWAIIFSLAAIIMGIIAISTRCPRTDLSMDYIGVIVGILSLLVTALLGWQVFNAIEMRRIIRDFDTQKNALEKQEELLSQKDGELRSLAHAFAMMNMAEHEKLPSTRYYNNAMALQHFFNANPDGYLPIERALVNLEVIISKFNEYSEPEKEKFKSIGRDCEIAYDTIISIIDRRMDDMKGIKDRIKSLNRKRINLAPPTTPSN